MHLYLIYSKIFVFLAKDAQSHWTKLKENFRKCLKRREKATRSGAGKTQLPTCQYFKELQFITDTVTNRPTASNVPTITDIFRPPPSPAIVPETYDKDDSTTSSSYPITTTPVAKKRKGDVSSSDVNQMLIQSIQRDLNAPPPQPQRQDEKDSDALFCLSLVQDFKDLPARKKRIARVRIMQVISDMHGDDADD